jgi:hypothetical protein
MRRRHLWAVLFGGLAWLGLAGRSNSRPDGPWQPLFNGKNLDGWTHCFNGRDKDASVDDLVKVEDGLIHIYPSGKDGDKLPFGYFLTAKSYSHYHARLEYKWGTKRFASKAQAKRDSGLLYHVVGPDKVWPRCIECQIQEGDTGDIFTVGTRVTATVDPAKRKAADDKTGLSIYLAPGQGGTPFTQGTKGITRIVKSETVERDGWNTVEVIATGGNATHMVNGKVVNRCTDIQQPGEGEKWVPLTAGRIAIQAEGAEVFFRKIEIRPIDDGPFEAPTTP